MKRIFCILISLCFIFVCKGSGTQTYDVTGLLQSHHCISVSNGKETRTAMDLAKRIIPDQANCFKFVQISDTSDVYELSSYRGKIVIAGNNANSMAAGLNYYLKNYCHTTVSWFLKDPVEMPSILPDVTSKVRVDARAKVRFFLNYCTLGYTMPWWQWSDWERLIDWMALNGINMPLAITGEEAVWEKVWQNYGMTTDQIRAFFTGPAILPWHRMINVDGWQGPLPQKWIDRQAELQKKILARERSLNMTPILPAFSGHVPALLKKNYPDAKITDVSTWCQFDSQYNCHFLNPSDPLFAKIQKDYITEQTKMFGTDHIYGADLFNEVEAPSWDPKTLASMSKAVYESMSSADKDAKWLQMGWLFVNDPIHWTQENIKAYLQAVPRGKVILLDYFCDSQEIWKKTESFYGQPYIFCTLINFGGVTNLEGDFHDLSARVEDTFQHGGGNFVGLGSTLEGFGVNAFMYDFFFDKAWNTGISDDQWVKNLAICRTGFSKAAIKKLAPASADIHQEPAVKAKSSASCAGLATVTAAANPEIEASWKMLCDSIYTNSRWHQANRTSIVRPHMLAKGDRPNKALIATSYKQVARVWESMLSASSSSSSLKDTYLFDIVNLGRQTLGEYFPVEYYAFCDAYDAKDVAAMQLHGSKMMETLRDMDQLLACHHTFSLEDWNAAARAMGDTPAEKDYYEEDARTIITYWGGAGILTDYAAREWSGMMMSYYGYRWQRFIDESIAAVQAGKSFDQTAFDKEMRTFEIAWTKPSFKIDYPKASDAVSTAKQITAKMGLK
jgi:alpha-N-acetylglucosaminidase